MAEKIVASARAAGGLARLDVERFWADQELSCKDAFSRTNSQLPLGMLMSDECVYAELGIEQDFWRYYHDEPWRVSLNKAYNDKAERIVGRRLLPENPTPPDAASRSYPPVKNLADVFEAKNIWQTESQAWWLMESAHSADELKALLDRVDAIDLRSFILPPNWSDEWPRLRALGIQPPTYRVQRGPVTFAMSIFGVENVIYLIHDDPKLAARLRDTILRVMLGIMDVLDSAAGYTPATSPRGFYFCNDNCCMLTPEMYEFFGYPILKAVYEWCSPAPGDQRGQHSDSAMGHLLPILGRLGMTTVNFGPRLTVEQIRAHMPQAVICGQLAPYTLMRNEQVNLVAETLRDFEMSREHRGVLLATAGSINNGSLLTSMRLIMATIQEHCRY